MKRLYHEADSQKLSVDNKIFYGKIPLEAMNRLTIKIISLFTGVLFFFSTTIAPVLAAINYTYDANGNRTSDGTNCFEYNDANQMSKVKKCSDNKIIAEYIYDHTGKRIIKKEYKNGVLEKTVYSPSDEYETVVLASNGAKLNTTYYKINDEMVAKKNPDGSINYYHNDHLGSNSVLTNQSGAVVEKTTYEPYGEVKSGGTKSKYGYTGQEKDNETGLNYYDSRYYDPHLQQFAQPDTLLPNVYDPQQLNRYSYARNNPLKYTDPSGHCIGPLAAVCALAFSNPITSIIGLGIATVYLATPQGQQATKTIASGIASGVAQLGSGISTLLSRAQPKSTPPTTNNPPRGNTTSSSGGSSGGGSSQGSKMNPFQRIAPLLPPIVNEGGKNWKSNATVDQGLNAAQEWLGKGYSEIYPSVFRSSDKLRQFRMKDVDILDKNPHFNFEVVKEGAGKLPNLHLYLIDINK